MQEDPPQAPLDEIEHQMVRSSLFTQASIDRLTVRLQEAETFVNELVDVLRAREVLQPEDLSEPVPDATAEPPPDTPGITVPGGQPGQFLGQGWPAVAFRQDSPGLEPGPPVNCAERLHVCHAVCCRLNFALTLEEVDAGKVKWDLGYPFLLRHAPGGMCVHNEQGTLACTVYHDRPGVCRRYSCVNDTRIWKDFEAMELNTEWLDENLKDPSQIRLRSEPRTPAPEA